MATAACGGATTTLAEESGASTDVEVVPTSPPTAPAVPTVEPTATPIPEPTATPEPAMVSWAADLEVGDCFNDVSEAAAEEVAGPAIDCDGEHEYEIFYLGETSEGPTAPYPTDDGFTDALFEDFCDPATIGFAGAAWDRLPFGTTVWTPTELDWLGGDRTIACAAEAGLRDENIYKVGTAAGGSLISNEGIVARATIGGQRDYFFSFQGSTLYPLTNGEFDLPDTTPQALAVGFLFASPRQDGEGEGARAYDYNYEDGQVSQLATGLEGWELASPHLLLEVRSFLIAARETEDDDWDLFLSRGADDIVALTENETDDQWPTVTPDGSQIVYHSNNDIWIMNVDGSDQRQLTTDPGGDFESAVSPDGSQIVFASDRSGNDDIWIMNLDGSDQRNLTNHPGNDAWPFFSADGSRIYFQTDRLGVRSNIMMMETDGSNQSYYSFEFMTNAVLLPDDVTARFAAELPSIGEVAENTVEGVVPGAAGERANVDHSSGRLRAALPAGWEYEEIETNDVAAMVAAPSISAFTTTWAADGALFTLIEAPSTADFRVRVEQAAAANDSSCTLDQESTDLDGSRVTTRATFECGESGSAIVVGVYEADAQLGLLFEGQWDGDPSNAVDEGLITAIGQALRWT